MRECPWCGRMNLNVYGYCQTCGRGFEGPEDKASVYADRRSRRIFRWPFSSKRSKEEQKAS